MKIHIICCNDSMEYAVIEDEYKAKELLEEMAKKYYLANISSLAGWDDYRTQMFWHIHIIEGE